MLGCLLRGDRLLSNQYLPCRLDELRRLGLLRRLPCRHDVHRGVVDNCHRCGGLWRGRLSRGLGLFGRNIGGQRNIRALRPSANLISAKGRLIGSKT